MTTEAQPPDAPAPSVEAERSARLAQGSEDVLRFRRIGIPALAAAAAQVKPRAKPQPQREIIPVLQDAGAA